MEAVMQKLPNFSWLKVDVGEANSALVKRYQLKQMPYLVIFDGEGKVLAEGDAALRWLDDQIRQGNP